MADNIFVKLASMRVELQNMNIKKSGHNGYSGYDYYELSDILPPINLLQDKFRTCSFITFNNEIATLTIVNSDNPSEHIQFTSPMAELSLKTASPVQNLGGVETYQRRYLYMAAFEIVENDYFDATQGKPQQQRTVWKKQERSISKLSEATSKELNDLIKECAGYSGSSVKDIINHVQQIIGKPIQQITEKEAKEVKEILEQMLEI